MSFFNELKRRNVFRVGIAYLVIAWLIAQVLDLVLANFGTSAWVMKTVLILLAAGLPISLFFAWVFELTSDGLKKESELTGSTGTRTSGRILNYVIIGSLIVAVFYFAILKDHKNMVAEVNMQTLISRPSVMVLPFTNSSGEASDDYIAFGITDELITGLQRYNDFPVVSRNASLEYSDTTLSAIEFAKSFGASYIAEGSINTTGDGKRILASLSNSEGQQVWAERYQLAGGKSDLFDVTDEIASKIAGAALQSEIKRLQRANKPPADAWEHYVKGLYTVLNYDPTLIEDARQHLDQAIKIAPDMAEAWWARGELEAIIYMTGPLAGESNLEPLYGIIRYFRKAHEISPFYSAACGCLGYMLVSVDQPDEARAVFSQALEAKPLSADLRIDYATFLVWDGRYDEALANTELALKLAPVKHDRAGAWISRSIAYLAKGNESASLDAVNRAMFITKDTFYTTAAIPLLYILDEQDAAARLFSEIRKVFPYMSPGSPVFYVLLKPIDDILAQQRQSGETDGPVSVAEIYALLDRLDKTRSAIP